MTYYAGTTPASPTPAKSFIADVLEPKLIAHGWEFVEEWVNDPANHLVRVWKQPAALNGEADIYWMIARYAADATVNFNICPVEEYTPGTFKAYKVAYANGSSSNVNLNAEGRLASATTSGVAFSTLAASGGNTYGCSFYLGTVGGQWWMSITDRHMVLGTRYSSNLASGYLGFIENEPAGAVLDTPNYCWANLGANSNSYGGSFREPGIGAAVSLSYGLMLNTNTGLYSYIRTNGDPYNQDLSYVTDYPIYGRGTYGLRGFFGGVKQFICAGLNMGDEVTADGKTFVAFLVNPGSTPVALIDKAI